MNPETGLCEKMFSDFFGFVNCLVELLNERIVICFGITNSKVQIWNTKTGSRDTVLKNDEMYISKMVLLVDQRIMASGFDYKKRTTMFKIWNLKDQSCLTFSNFISKCETVALCIDLCKNGDVLVITNHHKLVIWNPETKYLKVVSMEGYNDYEYSSILLTKNTILTFQIDQLFTWTTKNKRDILFSTNGQRKFKTYRMLELLDQRLACLNFNDELKIFNMRTKQDELIFKLPKGYKNNIVLFPNGNVACSFQEGIITICS